MVEAVVAMSPKKKDNPGEVPYVRVEDCRERHNTIMNQVSKTELALFGSDGRGGMVKDIADIRSKVDFIKDGLKGRLNGRDKAAIVGAVVVAVASIVVALLK